MCIEALFCLHSQSNAHVPSVAVTPPNITTRFTHTRKSVAFGIGNFPLEIELVSLPQNSKIELYHDITSHC
jgi:hypothetical protein